MTPSRPPGEDAHRPRTVESMREISSTLRANGFLLWADDLDWLVGECARARRSEANALAAVDRLTSFAGVAGPGRCPR